MNNLILWHLVLGIIIMKIVWIRTEVKLFKSRMNFTMLKTNAVEFGILLLQIIQVVYFPLSKTIYDTQFQILGILMYAVGMLFAFWGRKSMNRVWGIPGQHAAKQNKLITGGIFNYSRNPIYVGIIFIYLGFSIAVKSWLVILRLPLFIYLYRSAIREEKLLEKEFGSEFIAYKSRTPRFLFGF
jgi:protein-S-isoprenylcysteine O-methyltransferase Ste14